MPKIDLSGISFRASEVELEEEEEALGPDDIPNNTGAINLSSISFRAEQTPFLEEEE